MKNIILIFISIKLSCGLNNILDLFKCKICEGKISDCSCDYESVDDAVSMFYGPMLKEITSR